MRKFWLIAVLYFLVAVSATAKETQHNLLLDFFNGPMKAEGRFKSNLDGSERLFRVKMFARWNRQKTVLTLIEDFTFQDGEKGRKTWVFKQTENNRYRGTREDVVGEADVWQEGDVLKLRYRANIKSSSGSSAEVKFEDELVRLSKKVVRNTASVHWWFLTVGNVELTIKK